MTEDRGARRNRHKATGLWLVAALAVATGLLIAAVYLKSEADILRKRQETEAAERLPGEKSSTVSPTGGQARPLPGD